MISLWQQGNSEGSWPGFCAALNCTWPQQQEFIHTSLPLSVLLNKMIPSQSGLAGLRATLPNTASPKASWRGQNASVNLLAVPRSFSRPGLPSSTCQDSSPNPPQNLGEAPHSWERTCVSKGGSSRLSKPAASLGYKTEVCIPFLIQPVGFQGIQTYTQANFMGD